MNRPPGKLDPGGAGAVLRPRPPDETKGAPASDGLAAPHGFTPVPEPASGLQLLGSFERSGHREAPAMVRRADGQVIQLTPLLYAILESVDGHRRIDQIAAVVGERTGKLIEEQDIRFLIEEKLRPLGLVRTTDGSEPELRKANPLLGLRLRMAISNPRITRRIAAPFNKLFATPVVLVATLGFLLLTGWLLFERGIAPAVRDAIYRPGFLLLVFALTTLSAGFHELGHAAALVRGGGKPGVMGAGLYLVWPAFYTDVTDAYRLDRRARLRVDLGGIYFNAIFALVSFGLWAATGWEALLAVVPLQLLQMVRQLVPLVRLDGYHILADLTGVPDLFAHIKPILLGMLPTRWGSPATKSLKPWARLVVSAWVLLVVPLLLSMLVVMIVVLPRLAATAWDSLGLQAADLSAAWVAGDVAGAAVNLLALLAIAVPVLSMGYLIARVVRRLVTRVWRSTEDHPARRAVAMLVAAALVAGLATAWWPNGQYKPIDARERGRLADVGLSKPPLLDRVLAPEPAAAAAVVPQERSALEATSVSGIRPAVDSLPQSDSTDSENSGGAGDHDGFRFALPEAPGEGDNQALAVNYTDGSSVITMALSLIFADGNSVANSNEAYALASCVRCLAAAIAFQLVVVLDQADVLVPENSAVALSAYCVECATYSLAFQVIVALGEPLSDEAERKLNRIWRELEALQEAADKMSLDRLLTSIDRLEAEVLAVLEAEGGSLLNGSTETEDESEGGIETTASPSATPTLTPSPSAGSGASPSSSTEPSPSSEPSESSEPSPSPSPSESSESSESPNPSPSPSSSP